MTRSGWWRDMVALSWCRVFSGEDERGDGGRGLVAVLRFFFWADTVNQGRV